MTYNNNSSANDWFGIRYSRYHSNSISNSIYYHFALSVLHLIMISALSFRLRFAHDAQRYINVLDRPCTQCLEGIPDTIDCNKKKDYQILIIFGTNIPDTTGHQIAVQVPTSPNVCFCTACDTVCSHV